MAAEDVAAPRGHDGGERHRLEDAAALVVDVGAVLAVALVAEAEVARAVPRLVVAAEQVHLPRVAHLQREEVEQDLARPGAPVHVVAQEEQRPDLFVVVSLAAEPPERFRRAAIAPRLQQGAAVAVAVAQLF